jgi:hypothetical protein
VDRLTDEDQRMLWPDEIWPQEIGELAALDGGLAGPGGRVRVEAPPGCVWCRCSGNCCTCRGQGWAGRYG